MDEGRGQARPRTRQGQPRGHDGHRYSLQGTWLTSRTHLYTDTSAKANVIPYPRLSHPSQTHERPLKFKTLKLTDFAGPSCKSDTKLAQLGTLRVEFFAGTAGSVIVKPTYPAGPTDQLRPRSTTLAMFGLERKVEQTQRVA